MSRRREPIRHGTPGGYRAHFRHKVPLCDPCREADRKRLGRQPRPPAECGTNSGYVKHPSGTACRPCLDAHAAYQRQYTAQRRNAARTEQAQP